MVIIGIDPGVNTGFAVAQEGELTSVTCMPACEAENAILIHASQRKVFVWFEDARLRTWFGSKGREALQGAGSIKRDCHRWKEWLEFHDIPHGVVAPRNNKTKLDAEQFKKITGWAGRTNEHGRDAAMLIYGRCGTGRAP